jgi:hypothetical protein
MIVDRNVLVRDRGAIDSGSAHDTTEIDGRIAQATKDIDALVAVTSYSPYVASVLESIQVLDCIISCLSSSVGQSSNGGPHVQAFRTSCKDERASELNIAVRSCWGA